MTTAAIINTNCAAQFDSQRYCYFPWIKRTCDQLIDMLDPDQQLIARVPLFCDPDAVQGRARVHKFALHQPDQFKSQVKQVLTEFRGKGIIFTLDWYFPIRMVVELARQQNIPTIMIPHEGVFSVAERYYTDREFGYNYPLCDHALLWGELQYRTFIARGHSGDGLKIVGSPKLMQTRASAQTKTPAHQRILLALQNMDCQLDQLWGLQQQQRLLASLVTYALTQQIILEIRNPPNNVDFISESVHRQAQQHPELLRIDSSDPACVALGRASWVVSINSTMLLEAALMGKRAISISGKGLSTIWRQYDIETADIDSLDAYLNQHPQAPEFQINQKLATDFGLSILNPVDKILALLNQQTL